MIYIGGSVNRVCPAGLARHAERHHTRQIQVVGSAEEVGKTVDYLFLTVKTYSLQVGARSVAAARVSSARVESPCSIVSH